MRAHHRPAQPRLPHRRGPAVQGEAADLRACRHGGPGSPAARGVIRPPASDRHRRSVLHGWRPRGPARDLPPGRGAWRPGRGRRQPCDGVRRTDRQRHRGAFRRHRPRGCRFHDVRQGPGRRDRRVRLGQERDRGPAPAAQQALPLLQLPGAGRCRDDNRGSRNAVP